MTVEFEVVHVVDVVGVDVEDGCGVSSVEVIESYEVR